jgi:hypothetical protein
MVLGLLFATGVVLAVRTHRFVRKAVRVRARVVSTHDASVSNHDPSSQSAPVSRYLVELSGKGTSKRRVWLSDAVGGAMVDSLVTADGTIAVIFDPAKPSVVRIDSPWALYFIPAFCCAPAVLLLALMVYVRLNR